MRIDEARVRPVTDDEATAEQAEAMASTARPGVSPFNIFRTLANAPEALDAFMTWGGYVLSKRNTLSWRDRELVILRTGFCCSAGYEWAQHAVIGARAGLTDDEIARIKAGADAEGWDDSDRALLRATDELVTDHFVSDATWADLRFLDERQRMDLVFTVGQYTQVSMMLNTFGVQLDHGLELDPDLRR